MTDGPILVETPWGPWQPWTPQEVARGLAGLSVPWWIGGGYAIEAFVGRSWRTHGDVDVGLFRTDQLAVREHLASFDVHAADPPGTLRPWEVGETLPPPVHDVWVRERGSEPWRFALMLDEREGDEWVWRRDARVRRPVGQLTWEREGIAYLAPEVQLLYKAKGLRAKDQLDFENAKDVLSGPQRRWLAATLSLVHPGHPWMAKL